MIRSSANYRKNCLKRKQENHSLKVLLGAGHSCAAIGKFGPSSLSNGVICLKYTPGPTMDSIIVPAIPAPLRAMVIAQHHDVPGAGHLGSDKTTARVQEVGYWVGMLHDIDQYCRGCSVCQTSKLTLPPKAPLNSIPVGRPWEMVAIDILEVPRSYRNNRYLLVIQDYFTKWADAIPLPDQTAVRITNALVKVFTDYACELWLCKQCGSANFDLRFSLISLISVARSEQDKYYGRDKEPLCNSVHDFC